MIVKRYIHCLISLIFALSIAACTYNPLSSNNHLTGSPVAAVVGGAGGLGTAAALGVTSKPALGFATLAGASIGYYVTTLRFASAGIIQFGGQVYTLGDYLGIVLPSDKLFEDNSSELLPESETILLSVVNVLNRFGCENILVSGNTSGFSTARFERKLSEDRARVIAGFLWANGVNNLQHNNLMSRRLTYVGNGNYFPIANDLRNDSIRSNSRIQITAYPSKDRLLIYNQINTANKGAMNDAQVSPTGIINDKYNRLAEAASPVGPLAVGESLLFQTAPVSGYEPPPVANYPIIRDDEEVIIEPRIAHEFARLDVENTFEG